MACTFAMDIAGVDAGGLISLVVEVVWFDGEHLHHVVRPLGGRLCRFDGLLQGSCDRVTLIDVVVVRQYPEPVLEASASSQVLYHSPTAWD